MGILSRTLIFVYVIVSLCVVSWAEDVDGSSGSGGVTIGIDLGTTYSVVGITRGGRTEIIANDLGFRTTPSWVGFTETERLIGDSAKNQAGVNPENTLFDVKRLIGRRYDDPEVQKEIKRLPFKITNREGRPAVSVQVKGEEKIMSPEEISAMILTYLKQQAEAFLGQKVTRAVVTCPAYFNDQQRQATKDAGTIAGLDVVRVLNEPTAAAIAYGLGDGTDDEKNILVFDLGGGTFDVSLLTIEGGVFEVIATSGDTHLGGEDFDHRIMEYIVKQFVKKNPGADPSNDKKAMGKLRREAEIAKKSLSTLAQTTIEIDAWFNGIDLRETLTRAKFEDLNNDLFRKTIPPVKRVLEDGKLAKEDIDEIVLVGGSTRIPKVQKLIKDFFNGKEPNRGVNPDEAVAWGAAVQAAVLSGSQDTAQVVVIDSTPLSLGIETVGGVMTNIIPRGTRFPVKRSQQFSTNADNQPAVNIQIFEGERPSTKHNHLLGSFELSGIPPAPRGQPKISVTFEVDANGILHVSAVDEGSGNSEEVTITSERGALDEEEIRRMVEEAEAMAEEDGRWKGGVEAKNRLENLALQSRQRAEEMREKGAEVDEVEEKVREVLEWLEEHPMESGVGKEDYDEQREALEEVVQRAFASAGAEGGGFDMPDPDEL